MDHFYDCDFITACFGALSDPAGDRTEELEESSPVCHSSGSMCDRHTFCTDLYRQQIGNLLLLNQRFL